MASTDLMKELECSICLSIYKDPVTLRCGHNFCRVCIDQVLTTQDLSGVYSCPECREEFWDRPILKRNTTLRNVVDRVFTTRQLKKVTGICCTYCFHSPVPAVKSCLHCEASLCDDHLRVHSKGPEHVLTDPSTSLENRKCPVHKKILEYYCTEDAACICVSCCLIGNHKGHRMEPLYKASEKKKKSLRNVLLKLISEEEKTKQRVQSLKESWRKAQEKASGDTERVTALFIDIRRQLNDLEMKILCEISKQEDLVLQSLSDVIQELEIQKDELSRKMKDIEELCNMTDPLTVLQEPDTGDLTDLGEGGSEEDTGRHNEGFQCVELITHMSNMLFSTICDVNIAFYGYGPADISLDINTAHNNIRISEYLKTATWTEKEQIRPGTVKRFQNYYQVMSNSGFTSGRHYWDVETSGSSQWRVGMCYPSIDRRGRWSYLGANYKSWGLCGGLWCNNQCSVSYDGQDIKLPHQISGNRFRICLDYEAGELSFYELCDPIRHLHTFTNTFTEPLHAVLGVKKGYIEILQ